MASKFYITNPIFHDDNAAREHLEKLLWPHGPACPRCGVMGDRITKLTGQEHSAWRLQLQRLPQAVYRDRRHRHGAQPYPAGEMGFGRSTDGGQ